MTTDRHLYTKYGDDGETSLLYGGRVAKSDAHCEAYGATDEAVSAMGLARALSADDKVKEILKELQREMFTVGAELATAPDKRELFERHFSPLTRRHTERLEPIIDELQAAAPLPRAFILPGASPASAAIDVARTTTRRAEREAVLLRQAGGLGNPEILPYLNRVGDLLFILARYEDRRLPVERVTGDE